MMCVTEKQLMWGKNVLKVIMIILKFYYNINTY